MASKAQKNRVTRAVRALIRSNNVCIINTQHQQGLFDWRSIRPIIGKHVAAAMVEVPFRGWTLFPIGLCVDDFEKRYFKYDQVVIEEMYTSAQLGGLDDRYGVMQADGIKLSLIDHHVKALRDRCQPAHIQSTAWLLIPEIADIDQQHLDLILDALGAWGEKI